MLKLKNANAFTLTLIMLMFQFIIQSYAQHKAIRVCRTSLSRTLFESHNNYCRIRHEKNTQFIHFIQTNYTNFLLLQSRICFSDSDVTLFSTADLNIFKHLPRRSEPPEIEKFWFPEGQEEGRRSQLTCMVTSGDLPMTVTWLKDGRHMNNEVDRIVKQISEYSSVSHAFKQWLIVGFQPM